MGPEFITRVDNAVKFIQSQISTRPTLALVTGTGLENLLADIQVSHRIAYRDIPGFPVSTSPTHRGELIFGTIGDTQVVAQNGRFHLYEGWQSEDIVLAVYIMARLGVENIVVNNAAGALNANYKVADIMLIEDHLNFQGAHPLAGQNHDSLGPRFPDMSRAYDPDLRQAASSAAKTLAINIQYGIYAAVHGPEFETSAERRFLTMAGGDAVGMSTVPEVIAANHAGLRVLGFSAITNVATGSEDQQPDSLKEVIDNAQIAAANIRQIILEMISKGDFNMGQS